MELQDGETQQQPINNESRITILDRADIRYENEHEELTNLQEKQYDDEMNRQILLNIVF